MNSRLHLAIAAAGVAVFATAGSALAGVLVPAPAAGLLGVPGWIALGAGYAGLLVIRRLRNRS